MKNFVVSLVMLIVLPGCSAHLIQAQLDERLEAYNQLLRWNEWDNASLFARDSILEEFKRRAAAAKDVRVVDYRILSMAYNAEKREAIVDVEIDYYKVVSNKMKTLKYTQEWAYSEEKGIKGWRLMSVLPEFR